MYKKTILASFIIIIIFSIFYWFYFIKNTKQEPNKSTVQDSSLPTEFSTKKGTSVTYSPDDEASINEIESKNSDYLLFIKNTDELKNWTLNNNDIHLKNVLVIVAQNPNNEASFDPFVDVLPEKSNEMISFVEKENDTKLIAGLALVYEWYINLSGKYDTLSPEQKQKISVDFAQTQLLLNTK